jgi:hypothetical protein
MELTTFLAAWGAFFATAVALWDVYKWARQGRIELQITVTGGMVSTDRSDRSEYLSMRVTNVGEKPTTLQMITYRFFRNEPPKSFDVKPDEQGVFSDLIPGKPGVTLPIKLDVGEVWSTAIFQPLNITRMAKEGFLYIEAEHSLGLKPLKNPRIQLLLQA